MITEMTQIRRHHGVVLTRLGLGGGRAVPSGDWTTELPELASQIDESLDDACATLRFPSAGCALAGLGDCGARRGMTVHWIEGVADHFVDIGARLATDVRLDEAIALRRCAMYHTAFRAVAVGYPAEAMRVDAIAGWMRRQGVTVDVASSTTSTGPLLPEFTRPTSSCTNWMRCRARLRSATAYPASSLTPPRRWRSCARVARGHNAYIDIAKRPRQQGDDR